MGTHVRQWPIRLLAAGALPAMLTLGLGAAASAQTTSASDASVAHASNDRGYEVFGPYNSYSVCAWHQRQFSHERSYCAPKYRSDSHHGHGEALWYLYVYTGHEHGHGHGHGQENGHGR